MSFSPVNTLPGPEQLSSEMMTRLQQLNIRQGEYRKICNHLGRQPNENELGMFSVLWSEHCCYKHTKHLLKTLPTKGKRVVQGPGENAGVVDIGDNIQIAFKIESHNHPTAVEPFQGAATGVGGILRDIFTMNARPIALLNSLRFGPGQAACDVSNLQAERNTYLLNQAVSGIAHYGNCVGVPTIGGELFLDPSYSENPLVNVLAAGVVYDNNLMPSGAKGVGNPVLYAGSATGKDGMGGAAFASKELDENSNEDRPAVQVGDPFAEKLLIEACLEAFQSGWILSAQDMGAAGLTCATAEMASKGNAGMTLNLDKVPAREPGMKAHEYLLSESQERMLLVIEAGHEDDVIAIFDRWAVPTAIVGEVTDTGRVVITHHNQTVVDLPAKLLTDLAPSYGSTERPLEPEPAKQRREAAPEQEISDLQTGADITHWAKTLLTQPNIAPVQSIFQQYDRHVQNGTLLSSEHNSAGVIRVRHKNQHHSGKAIALSTDCNPRYVFLEPYKGTISAVSEAYRNLISVGAEPIAVTNNLNFGNPEKPDVAYQLYFSVQGLKDACQVFETPVTGGNVSLYNEYIDRQSADSELKAILPTPVIGMLGLLEDDTRVMTPWFKKPGDRVALVGRFMPSLAGSEYQTLRRENHIQGPPPSVSLNDERLLGRWILKLIQQKSLHSVQDLSLGGLLITLLECCLIAESSLCKLGLTLDQRTFESLLKDAQRLDTCLFGETNGCYLISYDPTMEEALQASWAQEITSDPLHKTQAGFYPLGSLNDTGVIASESSSGSWQLDTAHLSPNKETTSTNE